MQLPKSLSRVIPVTEGGREKWISLLPLLVSAVLVVLLAWQLVQLAWTVLGARKPAPASPAGPAPAAAARPAIDVQSIVDAHLFGMANPEGAGAVDPNAVAATQMSLVLAGTLAESDPEKGLAIIGDSAATAKVYDPQSQKGHRRRCGQGLTS